MSNSSRLWTNTDAINARAQGIRQSGQVQEEKKRPNRTVPVAPEPVTPHSFSSKAIGQSETYEVQHPLEQQTIHQNADPANYMNHIHFTNRNQVVSPFQHYHHQQSHSAPNLPPHERQPPPHWHHPSNNITLHHVQQQYQPFKPPRDNPAIQAHSQTHNNPSVKQQKHVHLVTCHDPGLQYHQLDLGWREEPVDQSIKEEFGDDDQEDDKDIDERNFSSPQPPFQSQYYLQRRPIEIPVFGGKRNEHFASSGSPIAHAVAGALSTSSSASYIGTAAAEAAFGLDNRRNSAAGQPKTTKSRGASQPTFIPKPRIFQRAMSKSKATEIENRLAQIRLQFDHGNKVIGNYPPAERQALLDRYRQRRKRMWKRQIEYEKNQVRKKISEMRPRVKGRFVKTAVPVRARDHQYSDDQPPPMPFHDDE